MESVSCRGVAEWRGAASRRAGWGGAWVRLPVGEAIAAHYSYQVDSLLGRIDQECLGERGGSWSHHATPRLAISRGSARFLL